MRNWGARLRSDVALCGWPAVVLENESVRVTVLAGKGAEVVEFLHKPTDTDFCHFTRRGIRRPEQVAARPFLDQYGGGWQEVFPYGGAPGEYGGVSFDQHAEVSVLPWSVAVVRDDPEEVTVRLEVSCLRTPFRLRRTMTLGSGEPSLRVVSEVWNEGAARHPAMWGQHLAFGHPYLGSGTVLSLPEGSRALFHRTPGTLDPSGGRLFPLRTDGETTETTFIAPEPGQPTDILYLTGFSTGRYVLRNPLRQVGLEVRWDAALLPYVWLWVETGGCSGYPWFGEEYIVGVEPFSSFPTNGLSEAVANGSALWLEAGEGKRLQWSITVA